MSQAFDLTPEQRRDFERRGALRLPGFYPRHDIDVMADRLWADLAQRFGILRDRRDSWTVAMPAQFRTLSRSGAFEALWSRKLSNLADALLGAGAWDDPSSSAWGGPLVTFPTAAPPLRRPPWHLDIGGESLSPLPVLRAFTFLEPAPPNGGGTLYVAGSHQLALQIERDQDRPVSSEHVRGRLKAEHAYFASLLSAQGARVRELMGVESQVGGHTVRLEEMTGAQVTSLSCIPPSCMARRTTLRTGRG